MAEEEEPRASDLAQKCRTCLHRDIPLGATGWNGELISFAAGNGQGIKEQHVCLTAHGSALIRGRAGQRLDGACSGKVLEGSGTPALIESATVR